MRPPAGSFVAAVTPAALHRGGVREQRVSVDALEHHRIVRRDARQRVVRRKARVAPLVLIPAAADHPASGRRVLDARARRASTIVSYERVSVRSMLRRNVAEPEQVRVRVDHAGNDGLAAGVDACASTGP